MDKYAVPSREKIYSRLKGLLTRTQKSCSCFLLTPNPSQVRLSSVELSGIAKEQQNQALTPDQLTDLLVKNLKKESESSSISNGAAISAIYSAMNSMTFSISEQLDKIREEVSFTVNSALKEKNNRFGNLVRALEAQEFPERLDELLAELAAESLGIRSIWESNLARSLLDSVKQMENNLFREIRKLKEIMRKSLSLEEKNKEENETKDFQSFTRQSLTILKNMSRKDEICFGSKGISRRLKSQNEFGVLSKDGVFGIFDASVDKVIQEDSVGVIGVKEPDSSMEFSPNGSFFCVSICSENKLVIFLSENCKRVDSWKKEAQGIYRAKWVNDRQILACFGEPGELELFEIGKELPLMKIAPSETRFSAISDLDLTPNRSHVVCCTWNKLVFKVDINKPFERLVWSHSAHGSNCINVVKVSNKGNHVLSGGFDQQIILTSVESGEVLGRFTEFTRSINDIAWSPNDKQIMVSSFNEVSLLRIREKDPECFEPLDALKKEDLDRKDIFGVNVHWEMESVASDQAYVLIGLRNGTIFKVQLESE